MYSNKKRPSTGKLATWVKLQEKEKKKLDKEKKKSTKGKKKQGTVISCYEFK